MTTNPRHLILKLLIGMEDGSLSVRDAITACALFGIRENSVRVAMVRLSAAGMIEAKGRGTYRIGPNAAEIAESVGEWRTVELRVQAWDGSWIAVHCGTFGRSDRVSLRQRDRAFQLFGFRELDRGLFVRPNNLVGGVDEVRERLHKVGLDPEAAVFEVQKFDEMRDVRARSLWNGKALTKAYGHMRQRLEKWLMHANDLDLEVAARESFLLGNDAIHQLVFDPLLPHPLADVKERLAFVHTVLEFDRIGHTIWHKLLSSQGAEDTGESALTHH